MSTLLLPCAAYGSPQTQSAERTGAREQSPPPNQSQSQPRTQFVVGVVSDPSGAVVAGATVLLMPVGTADGVPASSTQSGPAGGYRLRATAGAYRLVVTAPGFARFESPPFRLDAEPGKASSSLHSLDARLKLEPHLERIDVPGTSSSDANRGGPAIVLNAQDIESMPLDSVALLDQLQALAGGEEPVLYVDGFTGAKLPPRNTIREIRINQNPFSAQNDTSPTNGVIQVSTKPGTGQTHGEFYLYGDDSALNAANPFTPGQPAYYAFATGGSLSGPINRRASYFAGFDQSNTRMNTAINAQTLDDNLSPVQLTYAVPSPRMSLNIAPKLDLRAGPNSTMIFRYVFDRGEQTNGGLGPLMLASQGINSSIVSQTLQASNSQTIGARLLNETGVQYIRVRTTQTPVSLAPAVIVEGAFTGGGNTIGVSSDHQDRVELQDYLSFAEGKHYLNVGARLRVGREANRSLTSANGQFIFSSLHSYQLTLAGMQAGNSLTQIVATGGGASQFLTNAGSPDAAVALADAAVFFQDDWKIRRNLTLSYGLRFESQTWIPDHADWAPRAGFSWGFGRPSVNAAPRYTLHGGAGIFYRRFTSDSALQIQHQNGLNQQEYLISGPTFYPDPSTGAALGAQASPTTYRLASRFRTPYFIGTSIALDRVLGRYGTASVTYLNNRGVHTQLIENVNAPLPGTYNVSNPSSGVRPLGGSANIYEYASEGVYRSNRLSTNVTFRAGSRLYLFGYYMLRYDKSDAGSDGSFPANPYDLSVDYGRSLGDIRHTATLGGNSNLPRGIHASGYVRLLSGAPFNIVVGQDLNGDTQYNDRPAFATDLSRASVYVTPWGILDANPIAGQTIIPRNFGQGPGFMLVDLALGKSFGVGPALHNPTGTIQGKAPVARKYTLDLYAESQNLLNHPNLGPPVGTLNSPLFGRSLAVTGPSAISPDRIVDLQMSLRF